MKERLAAEKNHQPVEDCATCHRPHHAGQPDLLVEPLGALCAQCHDAKEKGFVTAHLGIDAGAMACVSCHDPHASKDPKLFRARVHKPFAARECASCHVVETKK
jgi:predicted CXXCH cytochrome family protein